MGLFESLGLRSVLECAAASAAPSIVAAALAKSSLGLQGLVSQFQRNGMGAQLASWIGAGPNVAVTPEALRSVLGNEHVKAIAAHFGRE
ncbi:MAG: YidB family protein [Pseudolabrys sp.]|jgi:uncharacterized protein YidB (DUF937 family)|nr:YidB family protein [Pseudolabrys sp.]